MRWMTRISLEKGQMEAVGGSWLQERYYSNDGDTVGDFLSFRSVYDINPFEVGADHSGERAAYTARRVVVDRMLEIADLRSRPFISLSNGELRRVILAKALLKERGDVVVDGGCGGLDCEWRRRIGETARAMLPLGVRLRVSGGKGRPPREKARTGRACGGRVVPQSPEKVAPVVEMHGIDMSFGRRKLFRNFSWVIRDGERWALRGPNGSGKTTLLALITGDSPFAYACDVSVFGMRRGEGGVALRETRGKIGCVSSAQRAYDGETPERQLAEALRPGVRLLLLDEPCCDMAPVAARRFSRRVVAWLRAHGHVAAVWVEHRQECVPPEFSLVMDLSR